MTVVIRVYICFLLLAVFAMPGDGNRIYSQESTSCNKYEKIPLGAHGPFEHVAISACGQYVALGERAFYTDRQFKIWDRRTKAETGMEDVSDVDEMIRPELRFSPLGKTLSIQSLSGAVFFWEMKGGRRQHPWLENLLRSGGANGSEKLFSFCWSDEKTYVAVEKEDRLDVFDNKKRQRLHRFSKSMEYDSPRALRFSPSEKRFAMIFEKESRCGLAIYESLTGKLVQEVAFSGSQSPFIGERYDWSPDASQIALADREKICFVDVSAGKIVSTEEAHKSYIHTIDYSGNGKWVLTASEETGIVVRDVDNGTIQASCRRKRIKDCCFTPDSRQILFVDGEAIFWNFHCDLTSGN